MLIPIIRICTFHALCLVIHLRQALLVIHQFFYPCADFPLQLFNFGIGFGEFVDFSQIAVLYCQLVGCLLCKLSYIVLCLVFCMIDLLYFIFQFLDQPKCMAFWVILICAYPITDIIVVMGYPPHTITCPQFLFLVYFGSECLYFAGHLCIMMSLLSKHPPGWMGFLFL